MTSSIIKVRKITKLRLDQFLVSRNISPSRSQIARWIREGHVTVNGLSAKASLKLKCGDVIETTPPEPKPAKIKPEEIPLDILYEDDDLVVVNKPASMVVHPGAGHWGGTLTNALLAHCRKLSGIGGVERPGIVHRLDKGTSGVMVIAKNDKTHIGLSEQFKDHRVKKIYWALVYGKMKEKEGKFESLISRSKTHRKKFAVSDHGGKEAITYYRVLKEGEGVSLVEIDLKTGRTHQIRVHFTKAGHSVTGDPLYGGHQKRAGQIKNKKVGSFLKSLDHTLLHARSLKFYHPVLKREMEWTAPPPDDFEKAIEICCESQATSDKNDSHGI